MTPTQSTDPQLGVLLALVALRAEFKHLEPARWSLTPDGYLSGTVYSLDGFAAYVDVIGGKPLGYHEKVREDGTVRGWDQLFTTWRDVKIALDVVITVDAPAPLAVAA